MGLLVVLGVFYVYGLLDGYVCVALNSVVIYVLVR